jgi:hypothetical protein
MSPGKGISMMTINRLSTGYYHARWNNEIWAQWPISFWAPRESDFFHDTGTPERIREAVAGVTGLLRSEGKDPVAVYLDLPQEETKTK